MKTIDSNGATSTINTSVSGDYKTIHSDGTTSYSQVQINGVIKTYHQDGSTSTTINYVNPALDLFAILFAQALIILCGIFTFTSVGRKQYVMLAFLVIFSLALRFLRKRVNPVMSLS